MDQILVRNNEKLPKDKHKDINEYIKPNVVLLLSYRDDIPEAKGKVRMVGASVSGAVVGVSAAAVVKGYI